MQAKINPTDGRYFFKFHMLMLIVFLVLGLILRALGIFQDIRLSLYLGLAICLYGIVITVVWGLVRYVIPDDRVRRIYPILTSIFYQIKPLVPRWLQLELRRATIKIKRKKVADKWPILQQASKKPKLWYGWPEKKQFALVLTHDVETAKGQENCLELMALEKSLGFSSSFNFVPLRYHVFPSLIQKLKSEGFEVGVHGLYHDGKLFKSKSHFTERAKKINHYLNKWRAVGFRAPAMHHNLDWIHALDIEYDMSTFDTDPFEPQSDGVNTIFPFLVSKSCHAKCYVEMPYTLPQDFTLYILMQEENSKIWKYKLKWIAENQGMVLLNTHPDYMSFSDRKGIKGENYSASIYKNFLMWIKENYDELYWNPLPKEMATFWMQR
jgi:hypothetical protein